MQSEYRGWMRYWERKGVDDLRGVFRGAIEAARRAGGPAPLFAALARVCGVTVPKVRWMASPTGVCERSCVQPSGVIELSTPYLLHGGALREPAHVPLPRGIPHATFVMLHEFAHYLQLRRVSASAWGDEDDADMFALSVCHVAGFQ